MAIGTLVFHAVDHISVMGFIFQMTPLIYSKSLYAAFRDEFLGINSMEGNSLSHDKLFEWYYHSLINVDNKLKGKYEDFSKHQGFYRSWYKGFL